jgi:hypothetical protein
MKSPETENRSRRGPLHGLAVAVAAVGLATFVHPSWAQEEDEPEFAETRVIVEINATDGDAGFHGITDGDDWKKFTLKGPDRQPLYRVRGFNAVVEQGLTENFFESAEPPCSEQPLEDFLELFPAGEYHWRGRTTDLEPLRADAELTHNLPAAPENLAPTGGGIDATSPVVLSWTPGTTLGNCPPGSADIPAPGSVELFGWQIVIAKEAPLPLTEVVIELPPSETSVTLPAEFMVQNAVYKFEVVAIELRTNDDEEDEKGNQTLSEAFFCTVGVNPCELPE